MKTCNVCLVERVLDEFHRSKSSRDGKSYTCKECAKARAREWNAENKERKSMSSKAWAAANPDRVREQGRRWASENPEAAAAGKRRAKQKLKTERRDEYLMRKRMEQSKRRLTGEDVQYGVVVAGDPCSYCGGPGGTIDHVVPLKADGTNDWSNLSGACRSCNSSKSSRDLLTYLLEAAA